MDEKNEPTERPLVSIIVPIYNTEEYLEECLDCLVNQTLQNIEIICINDATEDNSMEIVQKFAKNSNKIKIIENEVNKGLSATRNIGIGSVNGEYISFFDSDDIIEKTAFEKLYNEAKEHDQDVIVYNIKRFNDEGEEWFEILQKKSNISEYAEKTDLLKNSELIYSTTSCNKFIKTDYLKRIDHKFIENILFEDIPFTTKLLLNTDSIGIYPDVIYYWRVRDKSITQTNSNVKNLNDRVFVSKYILNYVDEEADEKYKPLKKTIYKKLLEHDFSLFINELDVGDEEFKETLISEIVPLIKTFPKESFDDIGELEKAKYNLLIKEDIENIIHIVKYEKTNKEITNAKIKQKNAEIKQLRIRKEEIRARKEEIRARKEEIRKEKNEIIRQKNAEIKQLRIRKEEIRARKEEIRKEKNETIRELRERNKKQREEIKELKSTKGWMKYKTANLYERGKNKL